LATWRLWTTSVFTPLNNAAVDAISAHAYLEDDEEMLPNFLDLSAHVAAYRALLKRTGPVPS
jgi:hypothetical protein